MATRRFTIDLGEKFDDLLTDLANSQSSTKAEIIRRAVASYAYIQQQLGKDTKLSVTNMQDKVLKDVVLP